MYYRPTIKILTLQSSIKIIEIKSFSLFQAPTFKNNLLNTKYFLLIFFHYVRPQEKY